jgi:hypothetical protein
VIRRLLHGLTGLAIIVSGLLTVNTLATAPAFAAPPAAGCNSHFLTFPTWYNGLTDADCNIKEPGNNLGKFIWRIALNVIEMVLQVIAYVTVGFIIFGGYKYLTSSGLPEKTVAARKTILNALIGLVLSFMSVAIVNLVAGNITASTPAAKCPATQTGVKIKPDCVGVAKVGSNAAVTGILNTAYYAAGITAVIVIVVCGILYSVSQGDAAKTKRAKDGILYAVVGLVVIMMAFVITNFVIGKF